VEEILKFPDLLRLIDERSVAFRAAITAAPDLDAPVPSCPGWTLLDLAQHMDVGRRFWAAIVAAGPADAPPAKPAADALRDREALVARLAASTQQLLDTLRDAGPDRGCWTWWGGSQSPQTAGAVARHQLQEVTVHTYDAQLTLGAPQPLPAEIALDGVEEFLETCCAGPYSWPYKPAVVDYHATEGRSWRLTLAADGVRATRLAGAGDGAADASLRGTAGELVQAFYDRVPSSSLDVGGDGRIFELLLAWDPEA
jgi:uncharacterized protein (TIGR03083 family)